MSTGAVGCCVKLYRDKDIGPNRKKRYKERNIEAENYRHEAQIKDLKLQVADLFLETQMLKKILNKSLQMKKENGSMITSENWDRSAKDAE
jgi:galactokinase/mevalonate kinase-like predicted kinase